MYDKEFEELSNFFTDDEGKMFFITLTENTVFLMPSADFLVTAGPEAAYDCVRLEQDGEILKVFLSSGATPPVVQLPASHFDALAEAWLRLRGKWEGDEGNDYLEIV